MLFKPLPGAECGGLPLIEQGRCGSGGGTEEPAPAAALWAEESRFLPGVDRKKRATWHICPLGSSELRPGSFGWHAG